MPRHRMMPIGWSRAALLLTVWLAGSALSLAAQPEDARPIGVFDSGTGGLAVLEQILQMDAFDNQTYAPAAKGDGRPDFERERFVFLADQANMPYGNYPVVGKGRFLVELVENDARFLLGNQYFTSPTAAAPSTGKRPVKAIVIACNTATAYGKTAVESLVAKAGLDIEVIGVIDAAAQGALEAFRRGPAGTIGILATEGTVASGAYPKAIQAIARQMGLREEVPLVQQGALGLAGAVDGAPEFLRDMPSDRPRPDYRGPSFSNSLASIDRRLLPRYDFDYSGHRMLWDGERKNPSVLQINSVENYLAYHLVSLLEKLRTAPEAKPLTVLILGCTHYPFFAETIRAQLSRLYHYRENGRHIYRGCLVDGVKLIDPAVDVGKELYRRLSRKGRLAEAAPLPRGEPRAEFYITVPCRDRPGVRLDGAGWFTYDYKYGRSPGGERSDARSVVWRQECLDAAVVDRLAKRVPTVWGLIGDFRAKSAKVRGSVQP